MSRSSNFNGSSHISAVEHQPFLEWLQQVPLRHTATHICLRDRACRGAISCTWSREVSPD